MNASCRRLGWVFFAALLPVLAAGCLPNATWLPDSSGFVYTGGKNKDALYLYDLNKKESRVLVEKGVGPAWPAVSADGQRIAVALAHDDGTTVRLEVIVFDRDGKELHRSDKMNWTNHPQYGPDKLAAQAFWVPGQDKLLLSYGETGIYDLKTKSPTMLDVNLATFGDTPIRPDGKGFLACKKEVGLKEAGLLFVDWDGKKTEFQTPPKDAVENEADNIALQGMLFFPLMHASRWDGSTAVVSWGDFHIKIDADKLTAAREHVKPAMSEDGKVIQDQVRLSGGGVVRAVELTKRYRRDDTPNDEYPFGSYRVEVVKQGAKEPKTLMDGAGYFLIDPSPDGKNAVVKCSRSLDAIFTESKPGQDMLYLIDGIGDVTGKIDLAK